MSCQTAAVRERARGDPHDRFQGRWRFGWEAQVLPAARVGGTVADVASVLHLSEGTVRNHLSAAIGKTGARTRAEAILLAEESGWLLG
jgi:DNA-binding NarL/FixJ family response regulator